MEPKIKEIIKLGECFNVEFKLASDKLPKNLFESVCAFLNSFGGYIILGVDDNGKIVGIEKDKVPKLKKDFVTLCNNNEVLSPTILLTLEQVIIDGKILLYCYVPESSVVYRTKNKVFKRNDEGDFDITNNYELVENLYLSKVANIMKELYFLGLQWQIYGKI